MGLTLLLLLLCCWPWAVHGLSWTTHSSLPSLTSVVARPSRRSAVRCLTDKDGNDNDSKGSDDVSKSGSIADKAAAEAEALRILGLGPQDQDLIDYLRDGRTLLAKRVSVFLPSECEVLSECLLTAAEKLVRLGASVEVLTDRSVRGSDKVPWSASVPFPRCVVRPLNLTSIGEVAGAIEGASAILVSAAHLPEGGAEALGAALPLAGAAPAPLGQMVLVSSVDAYDADSLAAVGEAGAPLSEEVCEATLQDDVIEGVDSEEGAEPSDLVIGREALLRRSSGARAAVLRACKLFGDDGAAAAETDSLYSDALGLQDLVEEYVGDLYALSGGGESNRGTLAALMGQPLSPTPPSIAELLPPADLQVQLTHTADLAGACVYALLEGLEGVHFVCAAPLTLQELFDRLAQRKDWEPIALRARNEADDGGKNDRSFFTSAKLENAGYTLKWPLLTRSATEGVVVPASSNAGATTINAGAAGDDSEPSGGGEAT
jgi:hypothetical protein